MSARSVIALSGVVGSGKSSTAKAVVALLHEKGRRAAYVRFRDFISLRARSAATPADLAPAGEGPDGQRWQEYRRRPLTLVMTLAYLVRSLLFRIRVRRWPPSTVLVFDRYFYDSLAHFDLGEAGFRLRLLQWAIPAPTVAAVLVIPESTILDRRPTYSADYARLVTDGYTQVCERFERLLKIEGTDAHSVQGQAMFVVRELARCEGGSAGPVARGNR
jgi:ABC-type dipeptide/oligopeptide/nickel transport system ATPase component